MASADQCRPYSRFDDQKHPSTTDYSTNATLSLVYGKEADVHMKAEQSTEGEVSQTTVAARGLPCSAFAWKGMGPSGYHKPPILAGASYFGLGLYILMLSFFMSAAVNGSPLGLLRDGDGGNEMSSLGGNQMDNTCNLRPCIDDHSIAENELFNRDPTLSDKESICAALQDVKRCIMKVKGCAANLMYHAVRTQYIKQEEENDCPAEEDENESAKTTNGENKQDRSRGPQPPPAMCIYQGPQIYRHCGLFGDPHLRTFHEDFQTCKVKGAWPLVNNDYVTVQVTNDPVEGNSDVTATSKLTVIVKGNPECTSRNFHMYQAESNSLPSTFDDGRVHVGPYHSLELVEVEPGAHVEIHIRYINTIVVVRRIGRYLTFSIQMPESLINGTSGVLGGPSGRGFSASAAAASSLQDVQLCLRGCPESELINFQDYLAARRDGVPKKSSISDGNKIDNIPAESVLSRAEAESVCREASVVGFYFDFCVFDLMATGDRNFTLSAVTAMQDVLRLDPSAVSAMENRTSLEKYDQQFYRDCAPSTISHLWRTSIVTSMAFFFMGVGERGRQRSWVFFLTVLTFLLLLGSR